MDIVDQIHELKKKQEKTKMALAKAMTQLEHENEKRNDLIKELKEKFNIPPDKVASFLAELEKKRESMLAEAKDKLDKINL